MRVVIINRSDSLGGAAVVMRRLMHALAREGAETSMLVLHRGTDDDAVTELPSGNGQILRFVAERTRIFMHNGFSRQRLFKVDDGAFGRDLSRHPDVLAADAIIIGWVNQAMISLADIERLTRLGKPVIQVMHDMWQCTAVCHHAGNCRQYTDRCTHCPLLDGHGKRLLTRAWERKRRLYEATSLHFVAVSGWLADRCRESALLAGRDIDVIANPLDVNAIGYEYHPLDGVPADKAVVTVAAARLDDTVKGFDTLIDLTHHIAAHEPDLAKRLHLLLVGNIKDSSLLCRLALPYTAIGRATAERTLDCYRASRVVLSTARHESFGATLAEGLAAGCVPVATDSGGPRDIIRHRKNGFLAPPATTRQEAQDAIPALAEGLKWALAHDAPTRAALHASVTPFDYPAIAKRYLDLCRKH